MDKLEYDLDYKERLEVRKKENEMLVVALTHTIIYPRAKFDKH